VLFSLTSFVSIIQAQNPVDYTLQQGDVTIENGIITACSYNFDGNTDGTYLIIPEELGIKGIIDAEVDWMGDVVGNDPFADKNIQSISLPASLVNIGAYSFSKNDLTMLAIPNGIEIIGRDAFSLNNIDSIFIPSSVKSIGINSFYNNENLDTVVFADNSHLVSIGSHAFVNTLVTTIKLPTPVVPDDNFEYWIKGDIDNTTYEGGEIVTPGNYAFTAKFFYTLTVEDLIVEDGIITSCSYDFSGKFITIPAELDGSKIKGIADASSQKDAIFYAKSIRGIKLPSTIETIGDYSFNSNSIDTLVVPASVKSIGQYAFWGFELDTVLFEDECNITTIGYGAFDNNDNLKMVFPTPVKEGYVFDKWEDDNNSSNIFVGGDEITDFETSYSAYFSLAPGTSIIELSGDFSFGDVTNTTTETATLTIKNTGNTAFNVSVIDLPSGFTSNWTSGEVAVDAEISAVITFSPTESIIYSGIIRVVSDVTNGVDSISVDGTGLSEVIQSIDALTDINVDNGTLESSILFPSEITITTDGNTSTIDISSLQWTCENYDNSIADTYAFTTDITELLTQNNIDKGEMSATLSVNVIVATGTLVKNLKSEAIMVFPNPVQSNLSITNNSNYVIELIDIKGSKLIDRHVDGNIEIDMSNMKNGTYILRFINDNDVITKKIIKE
jgi:hypothetical protein